MPNLFYYFHEIYFKPLASGSSGISITTCRPAGTGGPVVGLVSLDPMVDGMLWLGILYLLSDYGV